MKRTCLWVSDAGVSTGFAKCAHEALRVVSETYDVTVLGLNYAGDPHPYPYPIYPCSIAGDPFGLKRIPELCAALRPDVVVIQNDPWNFPAYLEACGDANVVGIVAVDGLNCRGRGLNGLRHAIFWTEFGLREARAGGYVGEGTVVPLGVDLDVFKPMDRAEAREKVGLPPELRDAFIVGNINRNQPRKRLDLTVSYFCNWISAYDIKDAYLFLHAAPTGDQAFDIYQLMRYFGFSNRLIAPAVEIGHGVTERLMMRTYGALDVLLNTSQCEGWHLPTSEAMACNRATVNPEWAALGPIEAGGWAGDATWPLKCSEIAVTPNMINSIGAVPDRRAVLEALNTLYHDRAQLDTLAQRGFDLMQQPQFRWDSIGRRIRDVIDSTFSVIEVKTEEEALAHG